MAIIDISVKIKDGMMVWPGDDAVEVGWDATIAEGHESNVSYVRMGAHVGTHLDMPLHYIEGGKGTESLELERLIGRATVVEVPGELKTINAEFLEDYGLEGADRVLFKTRMSSQWLEEKPEFDYDLVALDASGARWLVERGCKLVGVDAMSVATMSEGRETHEILLNNDTIILESLNLSGVNPGVYELICLPLKLEAREAAPVRAILLTL